MKGLLDTHAFLWMDSQPGKLSPAAKIFLQDPANQIHLSVVSVWEMQIKCQLGKLTLTTSLRSKVASQITNGILILPMSLDHVLALDALPPLHKDPFDRLLVAQAVSEGAVIITADPLITQYAVTTVW